jgi:hypothetical protein
MKDAAPAGTLEEFAHAFGVHCIHADVDAAASASPLARH